MLNSYTQPASPAPLKVARPETNFEHARRCLWVHVEGDGTFEYSKHNMRQCTNVLRSRTYPLAKTFSFCRQENPSLRQLLCARSGKRLLPVASRRQIAPCIISAEDSDLFECTPGSTSHNVRPAKKVDAAQKLALNDKTNAYLQATPSCGFHGIPSSTEEGKHVGSGAKAEWQPHRRQPTACQTKRLREVTARSLLAKDGSGGRSVETKSESCVIFQFEKPEQHSQKLGPQASSPSPNISHVRFQLFPRLFPRYSYKQTLPSNIKNLEIN